MKYCFYKIELPLKCVIFSKRSRRVIKSNQKIIHVKKQNALFLSAL